MSALFRVWAICVIATKRLLSQRGLALATVFGLVASVALTMSVPLYADAVYYRVLSGNLGLNSSEEPKTGAPPPFAFLFRYLGSWDGSIQLENTAAVNAYLAGPAATGLGLPEKFLIRHFKTDTFQLFPQGTINYEDAKNPLAWVSFAFISDLEPHVTLVEGNFPAVADPSPESVVEVMVTEPFALQRGLQVGETYITFHKRDTGSGKDFAQIPVRIAGIWKPADPESEFWCCAPSNADDLFLVPEATFTGRISSYLSDEIYLAQWYLVMDGSKVRSGEVASLLSRIAIVRQRAVSLLPKTRLDVSPEESLQKYRRAAAVLTIFLYAFSIPIIGLILAFIGLVVGLSVSRQRNEIAVLRSRGATAIQVVGIAALEGLFLGVLALALGSPLGQFIAYLIGRAKSFLNFTAPSDLKIYLDASTLRFGLAAVALAMIAQILPTIGAARHTIVTYKQERARALRPPWWQRAWLDVLLFIPAAYGAYVLRQQGSVLPLAGAVAVRDPFQNPLLFLVPALGIFALTLFLLRLLPAVMAAIAWVASLTKSVGLLLAARHLSRTPGFYTAPLVLLVLTLSLSAFTASLAQTLDHHLHDQTYYQIGADMNLSELGEKTGTDTENPLGLGNSGNPPASGASGGGPRWLFLPVSEHLKIPGVQVAARVGSFETTAFTARGSQVGTFMGIDRVDFPQAAFWRRDFAPASLGALMNALATTPEGVLVPRTYMSQNALSIGDPLRLNTATYGQQTVLSAKIVGAFDLFPTWYPDKGPLFVGNLDYLYEQAGGEFPYNVWIKTRPNTDYAQVAQGVRDMQIRLLDWDSAPLRISVEQQRPERQGLFGLLSVGFAAAAILTVLGFLLYALFSFRRRFIELGILRAVGLSSSQMTAFLTWELAFLILIGSAAGTALGGWVSKLFIPYLQVGAEAATRVPPYVVEIAWPAVFRIYALFGVLFVAALIALVALLLRMKIFQAIKLGETA
jgi:putative ABC transport system permease protein